MRSPSTPPKLDPSAAYNPNRGVHIRLDLYSAPSHTRTHSTRVLQDAGRVTSVGDSSSSPAMALTRCK